jgi:hypothetical protein
VLNVTAMANVIVWDLETIPDLRGYAAANGLVGKTDEEIRAAMATSSRSTSTIPLSASGRWLPTATTVVPGPSMPLAPRMLATAPRRH